MRFLGFLILLIISCKHDPIDPCEKYKYIKSWDSGVDQIVRKNCGGCHDHTGIGNFNYYSGVKSAIDAGTFQQRVFIDMDMPPSKMDTCDYLTIKTWVESGSPKNFK